MQIVSMATTYSGVNVFLGIVGSFSQVGCSLTRIHLVQKGPVGSYAEYRGLRASLRSPVGAQRR
jgi:hypothetical protein